MKKARPEPLGLQDMLGDAGAKPTLTWRGKTYALGFDTTGAMAHLEQLIRAGLIDQAEADCKLLSPEAAKSRLARLDDLLDRKHYATLQPGWLNVLSAADGSGVVLFVLALFHATHPELTAADVRLMQAEEPVRLRDVLRVAAPDFFRSAAACRGLSADQADTFAAEVTRGLESLTAPT